MRLRLFAWLRAIRRHLKTLGLPPWLWPLLQALVFWALALALSETRLWRQLEYRSFDLLTVAAAKGESSLPIIVVGIDDASMQTLNERWPWPRRLHARLIERLRDAGAAVVAFDVMFDHPSNPDDDKALAQAIERAGNVVLAASRTKQETSQGTLWGRADPIDLLVQAGAKVGLVNVEFGTDQVARHFPMASDAFWKEILFRLRAANPEVNFDSTLGEERLMRFVGPDHAIPYVSFAQVLQEDPDKLKELFGNALVLVGRETQAAADVGAAQVDVFATPFTTSTGRFTPGVELHATLIDNAINRNSLQQAPTWARAIVLLLVSLWCALLPLRFRPLWSAASGLTACAAVAGGSWLLFVQGNVWLPVFSAFTLAASSYLLHGIVAYTRELRQKARIRAAFSLFVPAAVADAMAQQTGALEPGGVEKDLTALFTDLADFTTTSEQLRPAQVARLLNLYFDTMTDIVFRHGGTVQGYIGDALMAFWGAPVEDPDHARKAVEAAHAMVAAESTINSRLIAEGLPPVHTRIGINSGVAVVGNIGSKVRFNYTALGDTINLAARLEGLNKRYGTSVLLSEQTLARQPGTAGFRRIEKVRVKGRSAPVEVATLCDAPDLIAASNEALALYHQRNWEASDARWLALLQSHPDDPVAQYYRRRIAQWQQQPPPDDWDGTESIHEK